MKLKKEEHHLMQSLPLLSEASSKFEKKEVPPSRLQKRAKKGWIITVLSVVLCVAVLWIAIGNSANVITSFDGGKKLAAWLSGLEFMDLSGKKKEKGMTSDSELSDVIEGVLLPDYSDLYQSETDLETEEAGKGTTDVPVKNPVTLENLYQFNYDSVPNGETPIIPMDLSLSEYGNEYINNSTGLKPDTKALLAKEFDRNSSLMYISNKKEPLVLILHTHGTEGYSSDGATSFVNDGGEIARSENVSENVVAVGKVLSDALNEAGISTIHCTVLHDQLQYKDSYARAEETIKKYLKEYPSIRLVIDLHRDSILKSGGELVRPVTLVDGEATAQVMCVVGSNWNGQDYPEWEKNLSLALKLRQFLNERYENLCRPVFLKGSTYNQELAPFSLLLEIGASGNSLEEAKRAALKVADALANWIPEL